MTARATRRSHERRKWILTCRLGPFTEAPRGARHKHEKGGPKLLRFAISRFDLFYGLSDSCMSGRGKWPKKRRDDGERSSHRSNETQDQQPSTLRLRRRIGEKVTTKCWVRCRVCGETSGAIAGREI